MSNNRSSTLILSFYSFIALVILTITASFFPQLRVWGFNHLAYWFDYSGVILGLLILLTGFFIYKIKLNSDYEKSNSLLFYLLIAIVTTVILGVLFYILRGKTHFLGDGTQLIPILISENLAVKSNNIGEQWLHIQLYKLLSGTPETRALLSYQIISISSGILSVITIFISSFFLFKNNLNRVLMALGLISGGYSLMFFGYLENYSIFAFLILLFSLMGIIGHKNLILKICLIPVVVLATWMHIFGLLLIPALLYLFIYDIPLYKRHWSKKRFLRYAISSLTIIVALVLLYNFAQQNIVFRFSLLPLLSDQFTLEDYTLFSFKHLIDIFNLIFMTVPALFVILLLLIKSELRNKINNPTSIFLMLASLALFVSSFLFDPKLSMPVDWDIFSIFSIPLTVFIFYIIIKSELASRHNITLLMLLAGFMVLTPRTFTQISERVAIAHAFNHCELDTKRNVKTFRAINDYVENNNLLAIYGARLNQVDLFFPEFALNENGLTLKRQGRFSEAITYFKRAISEHPRFSAAYYNIADSYNQLNQLNSAKEYALIAHGLSPENITVLNVLGGIAVKERNYSQGMSYVTQAIKLNKNDITSLIYLASIYQGQRDKDNYFKTLLRISSHPDADANAFFYLGNFFIGERQIEKAKKAFQIALTKNPDSSQVEMIYSHFPELKK